MMGAMVNDPYRKIPVLIGNDVLYESGSLQLNALIFYSLVGEKDVVGLVTKITYLDVVNLGL